MAAMVQLRFFASLRETLGVGDEAVTLPDGVDTVAGLQQWLQARGAPWRQAMADERLPLRSGELRDLGQEANYTDVRKKLSRRLHEVWHPERAAAGALDGRACHEALAAWGRAVMPDSPDALPAPDPPVERDVELL